MFSAQLHVLTGALAGQAFNLIDEPITIGRASDNLIFIEEESVSRHHAVLKPESNGYVLHDLNSTNGCWVNGWAVTDALLRNGDVIRVGTFEICYEAKPAPPNATHGAATRQVSVATPKVIAVHSVAGPISAERVPPAKFEVGDERRASAVSIPPRLRPTPLPLPQRIIPIPPLPVAPVPESPRQGAPHGGIRFEISYSTSGDRFINAAQKLVDHYEASATFVPFMSYWPTYDSMTNAQSRWYFHWRGRVRINDYPDTDLSYVFVHVYELINNVGVKNESDGYEQLRKLWLNYRERFTKLDNYLIDWISDYAILNKCTIDPLQVYREAFERKAFVSKPDILLSQYETTSFAEIPISLVQALSDYRIQKSKFYLQGNQDLVGESLSKALCQVDFHLRTKTGMGIFGNFRPAAPCPIHRYPFHSAVYAGTGTLLTVAKVYPYSTHAPLREFLTTIIKHTENVLREHRRYRGKLRGYELNAEIAAVIRKSVLEIAVPPAPRQRIEVDMERIEELTRASDQVRKILLEGADTEAVRRWDEMPAPVSDNPPIERPEGTPAHLLTDLNEINRLLVRITEEERRLLEIMRENQWQCESIRLAGMFPGILIEHAVDHINEIALKFAGDILLASEGGKILVTDDYRDELEFLLKRIAASTAQPIPPAKAFTGLPPEWGQFMSRLKENQLRTLRAIATNGQSRDEIRKLATEVGIMPETLIDSINELAHETIGDIIIDTNSVPPVIEEDDFEMVQKALALTT